MIVRRAALVLLAACGSHDGGEPLILAHGHVTEHVETRQASADFSGLALDVKGSRSAAYDEAIRAAIPIDPAARVTIGIRREPPTAGEGEFSDAITIDATWWRLPQVRHVSSTLDIKLSYTGATVEAIGKKVGEHIATYLAKMRPADAARPALAGPATQLAVGPHITCTLHGDHSVHCWGAPAGSVVGDLPSPTPIKNATAIAAGDYRACALSGSGDIECVGRMESRELDPDGDPDTEVTRVCKLTAPIAIAAGADDGCAIVAGGKVMCWALGTARDDIKPHECDHPVHEVQGIAGATALALGATGGCALVGDTPWCWHGGKDLKWPYEAKAIHALAPAAAPLGGPGSCALTTAGDVRCVDEKNQPIGRPRHVAPGSQVALAGDRGYALAPDGSITAFALGGDTAPAPLASIAHATAIGASIETSCAIADGKVSCAGDTAPPKPVAIY